jgi:hypothetical protein
MTNDTPMENRHAWTGTLREQPRQPSERSEITMREHQRRPLKPCSARRYWLTQAQVYDLRVQSTLTRANVCVALKTSVKSRHEITYGCTTSGYGASKCTSLNRLTRPHGHARGTPVMDPGGAKTIQV